VKKRYVIETIKRKLCEILALMDVMEKPTPIPVKPTRVLVVVDKDGERRVYKEY